MFLLFKQFTVVESVVSALAGAHTVRKAHGQRTALAAVARLTPVPLKRRGWLEFALRAWPIGQLFSQFAPWQARAPPAGYHKWLKVCVSGVANDTRVKALEAKRKQFEN